MASSTVNHDALLAAFASGATPDQMEAAAYGTEVATQEASSEESEEATPSEVDNFFNNEPEQTENSEESSQEPAEEQVEQQVSSDVEEVEAGGSKFKIDYTDRKSIKDAYLKAAGMRKFQRERDEARKKLKEVSAKQSEQAELWSKVEEAASKNDYNSLMKIMTGGKTDFDTLLQSRLERMKLREEAPESEKIKFDQEDKIATLEATVSRQSSEIEKLLNKVKAEKEEIATKAVQSRINPVFEKYRFAGKLGNAAAEHKLDKMIWNDAMTQLEELGLDEEELTPEIIEREFKAAAELLGNVTKQQAEKKANEISQERKKVAKEAAQLQQVKGQVGVNLKQEAAQKIRGDLSSIFKNWDKYKGVF